MEYNEQVAEKVLIETIADLIRRKIPEERIREIVKQRFDKMDISAKTMAMQQARDLAVKPRI